MNAVPRVVSASAVLALVLATLWLFWPSELGGSTTYVTTHGVSMQPRFHTGDLAVLTRADGYSVGDIVAYRSDTLHTIVMHRIVSGDKDGFTTQGDNNDWLDRDRPTQEQILGGLFVRIPQGGKVLGALRSPAVLLCLAGVALALLGATHDPRGRRTARWLRRRIPGMVARGRSGVPALALAARGRPRVPALAVSARGRARQVAVGSGAVVLVAAVSCAVLLAVPPTETKTRTLQVVQKGQFSYTGTAVAGTTYPTGVIATGDTVWNRLVHNLSVSLVTTLPGPGLAGLTGSVHLDVRVSAADGWSAIVNSGPAAAFTNGTATAAVPVNPARAAELLSRHNQETGSTGGSATLTVTPVSQTSGTVQGKTFTPGVLPGLAFTLDGMSLRPASAEAGAFAPSVTTPVEVTEVGSRSLKVLAASVPIATARKIAGAVLLLSLVALGAGGWLGRIGRDDVSNRFLIRHADRILTVDAFDPGPTVIDVSDAEALHRVAERFDTLVLHHAGADEDVFAVRDVDATYRFVVPGGRAARARPPVPVPVPVPEPVDATTPLPRVVPGGLWGQVA